MIKAPPQRDNNAKKREKESKSSVSRLYRSAFQREHFLPGTNLFRLLIFHLLSFHNIRLLYRDQGFFIFV